MNIFHKMVQIKLRW